MHLIQKYDITYVDQYHQALVPSYKGYINFWNLDIFVIHCVRM